MKKAIYKEDSTPKGQVCALLNIIFHGDLCDMVREMQNCEDVEITDEGEIWIAKPQTGHWLSDDHTQEFVDWVKQL